MQQVHDEVRRHIIPSNVSNKTHEDKHCHFLEFSEGDMVVVRIHPKRLPLGANKKLHPRNVGPFKVLKKLSLNAYTLELPSNLGISPTFNVAGLTLYHGHDNDEESEEQAIALPAAPPANKIIDVLNDQLVFTHQEGF